MTQAEDQIFEHQDFLRSLYISEKDQAHQLLTEARPEQISAVLFAIQYYFSVCGNNPNKKQKQFATFFNKLLLRVGLGESSFEKSSLVISFLKRYVSLFKPLIGIVLCHVIEKAFVCISACI